MSDDLVDVSYTEASRPAFQHVVTSRFDFTETIEHLKETIAKLDLWIIHEINPQMLLERGGFAIHPARQLLFFHPRYVVTLLNTDPAALIEIPLKMVVLQAPDGCVTVRHADVRALLGRYDGLDSLSDELAGLSQKILHSVDDAMAASSTAG